MHNNDNKNRSEKILTVIVPAYNMARCLEKNLESYVSPDLFGKLSVIVLDNSSEDKTLEIARSFEARYPEIFTVITKPNNGYGGSVNKGIELTSSKYFKVIDADDRADTAELISFVKNLEECEADVVETPYFTVDAVSGEKIRIDLTADFSKTNPISAVESQAPFPSLHTTALRTDFVRRYPFTLLENAYYVDEELAIYPLFNASTVRAFDNAVYCYSINDASQSVATKNKVKNLSHRDSIVKRLMKEFYDGEMKSENRDFCFRRIARSVGDHYTTLYVLHGNKREGRKLAKEFSAYLAENYPQFLMATKKKRMLLSILNFFRVSLPFYHRLKKIFGYKEISSV